MFLNLPKATILVLILVLHTATSACQTNYVFGDPVDPKQQSPNLRTITMWLENLSVSVDIPAKRRGKCINVEDEVPPTWAEGACPDHVYIPPATSCIFFPGKDCQS
ncbi:hypothetical protein LTS08_008646 [Lithohypha guttulata]|nr:hypothetical protein LTS08_008646 [Lithohypha guttulata]